MLTGLTPERVRADVDVLARAGVGADEFIWETISALHRAVPWAGACIGTIDPETLMITSAREYGALEPDPDNDALFGQLEYSRADDTTFQALAGSGRVAASMHLEKRLTRSDRWINLMAPIYGFGDEMRAVCREDRSVWGCTAFFREPGERPFDADDVEFLASLAPLIARCLRMGLLSRIAEPDVVTDTVSGPAVVLFDAADRITHISAGARDRLDDLARVPGSPGPRTRAVNSPCSSLGPVGCARTRRCRCPGSGCGRRPGCGSSCTRLRWTASTADRAASS